MKICDFNGNPIIFYHGTPGEDFTEFDLSKSTRSRWEDDEMYFFAFKRHLAADYAEFNGTIILAYLSANKLFDTVKNPEDKKFYDCLVSQRLENDETVFTQGDKEGYAAEQTFSYPDNWINEEEGYPYFENGWLFDEIKHLGYDAFILSEGNGKLGIAVFSKKQIEIIHTPPGAVNPL